MRRITMAALLFAGAPVSLCAHAQAAQDWTGAYLGGALGTTLQDDDNRTVLFDTNLDGGFGDTIRTTAGADAFSPGFCNGAAQGRTPADGCRSTDDNVSYALRAGYDWQIRDWVVGVVGEISSLNIGDDVTAFSTTPASYTFTRDLNSVAAIRGRAGYVTNNLLVYATAGVAFGDMDHSFTTTNRVNSFTPSGGDDNTGVQFGAGIEAPFANGWSLGLEYLYTSLQDDDYRIRVGPGTAPATSPFLLVNPQGTDFIRSDDEFNFGALSVTLNWRF